MKTDKLIEIALKLAEETEVLSENYHVKSSQHEQLLWESAVLKAKIKNLQTGEPIQENLQESILLGTRGESTRKEFSHLYPQLKIVYEEINKKIQVTRK